MSERKFYRHYKSQDQQSIEGCYEVLGEVEDHETKQAKIEAEARRVAAGIDGDYAHLLELCGNWPGQEMAFLDAVENTGNYEVLPWDHPTHTGSCTCVQWSPCSFCYTNDYWIDWRAGK